MMAWLDIHRQSPLRSSDISPLVLVHPSISWFEVDFVHLLTPLPMWRRNYQPLPQDKSEESLNNSEVWDPSTILFYLLAIRS